MNYGRLLIKHQQVSVSLKRPGWVEGLGLKKQHGELKGLWAGRRSFSLSLLTDINGLFVQRLRRNVTSCYALLRDALRVHPDCFEPLRRREIVCPLNSRCSEIHLLYVVSLDPLGNASPSPVLGRREGDMCFT